MKKLFFVWVLMATFVSYVAAEVIIVGHRGSYWGVENTSAAFIKGVTDGGYNYLETDVKVTKDKQYVCWHDDNLDRVGHTGVTIAGNTLATLKTKQLTQTRGSTTYTGYLTSVAEYLDICKQYNVLPLIELKWATGINTNDCSKIPGLVQLISDKGFYNTCIILTSMKVCLQYIRQNYPGIKCQYLVYSLTAVKAETLTWCKANGVHLSSGVGSELNSTWVNNFHNAGLEVGVWTVNTSSSFTSYQNMGVDYITTDYLKFEAQTPTIVASPTTLSISAMVGNSASKTFTVSGYNTTANITVTSNNNMFTVSPASLAKTGGTVTVTYTPTAVGTHSATITLKSTGAADKTVNVTGTAKTAPITFTQIWNYSQTSGQSANWATDFTKIRNMDYGSGKLYVITETSKISVINAQTGAYLGDLSTQGLTGGTLTLIDCKVVGTSIVACNLATSYLFANSLLHILTS